jgi:hypothetical protein
MARNPISMQTTNHRLDREIFSEKGEVPENTVNGCFAPGLAVLPKVRAAPSIGSRTQFD